MRLLKPVADPGLCGLQAEAKAANGAQLSKLETLVQGLSKQIARLSQAPEDLASKLDVQVQVTPRILPVTPYDNPEDKGASLVLDPLSCSSGLHH